MRSLAWTIAVRYLFSKKSHSAVNVISLISVAGVAVATAAIVIVLSVFNGFTDLGAKRMSALDPDLKVVPVRGKAIADGDSLATAALQIVGVRTAMPIVEERALAIYDNQQMPVQFKGVGLGYDTIASINDLMIDGIYAPFMSEADLQPASLSIGVAVNLNARPGGYSALRLYAPRRLGRINPANPANSFREQVFRVSGVFSVQQPEYDTDRMIIPIEQARQLLEYDREATAIEVTVASGYNVSDVAKELANAIGADYRILTRNQLEEKSYRMIMIEKWVTFLMLAFILVIASFNIISTLSLLVLEKRDNMTTLRALGASGRLVRSIFLIQGWLISVVGGIIGIVIGTILSLCQQYFKMIKLSGDPSQLNIDYYPMRVEFLDLAIVMALVIVIGAITSQITRIFKY